MAHPSHPGHGQSLARSPAQSRPRPQGLFHLPQLSGLASAAQGDTAALCLWHPTRTCAAASETETNLVTCWHMDHRNHRHPCPGLDHTSAYASVVAVAHNLHSTPVG